MGFLGCAIGDPIRATENDRFIQRKGSSALPTSFCPSPNFTDRAEPLPPRVVVSVD